MSELQPGKDLIVQALLEKSSIKQDIFAITKATFSRLKFHLSQLHQELVKDVTAKDSRIEVSYRELGDFEVELKVAGDILVFTMHTNVFNFDENHEVHKTGYVREDSSRGYVGLIQIHNFLADSFKYNRLRDTGYLIARIFINREQHFFVEGMRQLGFLYNEFDRAQINDVYLQAILESSILYAIDFDLLVPPFQTQREITVHEMKELSAVSGIRTAKRLGFKFYHEGNSK